LEEQKKIADELDRNKYFENQRWNSHLTFGIDRKTYSRSSNNIFIPSISLIFIILKINGENIMNNEDTGFIKTHRRFL
jgi:hypothetical protein